MIAWDAHGAGGSSDPPESFGTAGYADANDLGASIPPATLVVLPDVGHACNVEAPEAFNQAVRTFLQAV